MFPTTSIPVSIPHQPKDFVDSDSTSESKEDSDGPLPLESMSSSESGYEANIENKVPFPNPDFKKRHELLSYKGIIRECQTVTKWGWDQN